ncbi:MAG: putative lipid II flippase FtsW [Oscillospiraceae bacterium]|nr:putative lipid II flippase FtsW [Oscillospiraceae bacterium]
MDNLNTTDNKILEFQRIRSQARARARVEAEAEAAAVAQAAAQTDATAATESKTEGMPSWTKRELSSEYVDEGRRSPGVDKPFLVITLVLMTIGLIMLLSASFSSSIYMIGEPLWLFRNQAIFAVSGVFIMLLISRISIRVISKWSAHLLVASIIMLVLVLIIGIRINGATRWLGIGGENTAFSFQPSEIAKLAVILSFAQIICKFGPKRMKTLKYGVMPFAAITAVIIILLWWQPHVSAAIIILATAIVMMFAGGTRIRYFVLPVVAAVVLAGLMIVPTLIGSVRDGGVQGGADAIAQEVENSGFDFSSLGHWGRRIDIWLDPDADPLGGGFQTRQSLNAVGSGGLLGQGLGQSRQKHQYLPEEHNDFIFAIVAEELGFVGAMLILSLFALLVIRGYWLALHAKNRYSSLVVIGITSLMAIQVFFNVAVVTNLIPATGISLPLFSYGGTALWMQLAQIGIILSVSREIPVISQESKEDFEGQEHMI